MAILRLEIMAVLTVGIAFASAEPPVQRSGPYPPSGWRPRKPFNLPRDYLPPTTTREVEQQRQGPAFTNVEVNKERVEFLGQIQGSQLSQINRQPHTVYGPPKKNTPEFLGQQQLPFETNPQQYKPKPQTSPQAQSPSFLQSRPPVQFGQRPPFPQKPPNFQGSHTNFKPQEPSFTQQTTLQTGFFPTTVSTPVDPEPAKDYGAPPLSPNANSFNIIYPDPRSLEDGEGEVKKDTEVDNESQAEKPLTPIEALNAAIDTYNRALSRSNRAQSGGDVNDYENYHDNAGFAPRSNDFDGYPYSDKNSPPELESKAEIDLPDQPNARFTMGQYFVLGLDNTLQRVTFTTTQDEDERKSNGFTAQLKYRPAGELRDPVFRYNNRGQLVRVLKK